MLDVLELPHKWELAILTSPNDPSNPEELFSSDLFNLSPVYVGGSMLNPQGPMREDLGEGTG